MSFASRATLSDVEGERVVSLFQNINDLIADGVTNAANNVDSITSLVIGPGQRVHVSSATQNNVFSLIGFEDVSSEFTVRVFGQN